MSGESQYVGCKGRIVARRLKTQNYLCRKFFGDNLMVMRDVINRYLREAKKFAINRVDNPALILMYHRVAELHSDPFDLAVSPDNFSKQIEYLKENYNVVDPSELVRIRKQGGSLPKKSIIITFDDGYLDNYTNALPILEYFDACTIFFIATANIGRNSEFWSDSLGRVFYETKSLPDDLKIGIDGNAYRFDTSTEQGRLNTFKELHLLLMRTQPLLREESVGCILDWAGLSRVRRDSHQFMNREEVKCLAESQIATLGAHTHNHPRLSSLSRSEQYEEISKSLEILKSISNRPVKHFSYPYGSTTGYDSNSIEICKSLGFALAFGGWGVAYKWSDDYQLPRFNVGDWDIDTFRAKLKFLI